MAWHDDPDHPFAGIAEKLKRANESIDNLASEIKTFIEKGDHPTIPKPNEKGWEEAVHYNENRKIPKRFGVLGGEIVHHLRSCFDHIVWHFTIDTVRIDPKLQHRIEFPVWKDGTNANERKRFEGQIQGVTNLNVRHMIEGFQPHRVGINFLDHPLCVIHNLDRFDKHRELPMISSCAQIQIPPSLPNAAELGRMMMLYKQGELPEEQKSIVYRALKEKIEVVPDVAFPKIGSGNTTPVIPLLTHLSNFTRDAIEMFASET